MPLHPEYEAMLAALEELGGPKIIEMAVGDAREMFRMMQPATDIPVGKVENTTIDGPGGQIPLRIYTPSTEVDGPYPVAMMFHGGGWVIGDLDTADGQSRALCAGAGCIVVSVDYRLAPEHRFPAAADDCFAATCWASENCAALGGDPARIAVVGDSAGGNLAAVVALMARDAGGPDIAAQVLVYPVMDGVRFDTASYRECAEGYMLTAEAMHWFWDQYADPGERSDPRASPLLADDLSGQPPALVMTAEYDPLRDEGEAYAAALEAAGNTVECVRFDGFLHGFFAHGATIPATRPAMEKTCAWIRSIGK